MQRFIRQSIWFGVLFAITGITFTVLGLITHLTVGVFGGGLILGYGLGCSLTAIELRYNLIRKDHNK